MAEASRVQDPSATVHRMLGACVRFPDKKVHRLCQILQVCEVPEMLRTCGSENLQGGLGESSRGRSREV